MKFYLLFLIANISILCSLEPDELLNRYDALFHCSRTQWDEKEFTIIDFKPINYNYNDSDFVNKNIDELRYILKNFSVLDYPALELVNDSVELQKQFIKQLKSDSDFIAFIYKYFSHTLEPQKYPKEKVKLSYILALSVKFFQIIDIDHNFSYVGKVCSGVKLISETEKLRNPLVEAFCFSSVFKNLRSEEFNLMAEFRKTMSELYTVNLGNVKEDKILRAQGAVMLLMKNNPKLEKMLRAEYDSKKEFLPFIMTD